ncbi:unnamed protein product [Calypogeia fissa]
MYWMRFVNKILVASRTGLACLIIGSMIMYVPTKQLLERMLAFTTYAPTIAISACDNTVGKVVSNIWAIMQVALFVMLETMIILQFFPPPIPPGYMLTAIFISSFIVSLSKRVTITGKKVGLAQISMTFIAANLDPHLDVVWMPLRFLASIFVGATAALLALLIPYPLLATLDVRRLSKSAVTSTSDLLQTVASAFCATDASTSYSICLHSKVLSQAASEILSELQVKQNHLQWEMRGCGRRSRFRNLTEGLEKLHLHLAGMELALQSHYLLQSSTILRATLEMPLMKVVQTSMALLNSFGKVRLWSSEVIDCVGLIKEGKEALVLFDEALFVARTKAFYLETRREPPIRIGPLTTTRSTTRSMENFSLDALLKLPTIEAIRGFESLNGGHTIEVPDDIISPAKRAFMSRVTTYFFVFSLRLYIEGAMTLVDANWKNPASTAPGLTANKALHIADEDSRPGPQLHMKDIETGSSPSSESNPINQTDPYDEKGNNASDPQPLHLPYPPPGQCIQCALPTIPMPRVNRECLLEFLKSNLQPSKSQICKALKISLAMMLATIFGMLALPIDSHCAWAPVTVAIFLGNHQGGSFRLAIMRIQGTVLGSIYGYLVVRTTQNGYLLLFGLMVWVTASDFVRSSKIHGYSGIVSAQSAATMILGDYPKEIKLFAMDRVTETFVGVMCFVFVETVLFPERAVILVKRELVSSLKGLRNCVASVCTAYAGRKCESCRCLAIDDVRKIEQALRTSLERQSMLCAEAMAEPDLWFVPFSGDVFNRLIAVQGRMLNPLCFMRFALQATVEENVDEHMQTLLKPVQASLMGLEEQVVSAIDFLQALFVVPELATPMEKIFMLFFPPCLMSKRSREKAAARKAAHSRKVNTPLQLLGKRRRSVAGTPLHLKASQKHFEKDFEIMLEEVVQRSRAGGIVVSNSVMLSLSSLSFCLHEIMKETVELEKTIYELLQAERPWSILDQWDTDIPRNEVWQQQHK